MFHFRELALIHASHQPLFTKRTTYTPRESYPFVFDAQAEAQQTSSFIGGTKVYVEICYWAYLKSLVELSAGALFSNFSLTS